jgi:predicted transcriptional regulator
MNRLVEKGYLTSEKTGKIRWYTPQITEEEYLDFATQTFVASHHEGSIASLVQHLSEEQAEALRAYLAEN